VTGPTAETKFGLWATPKLALSIEYRPDLIDQIYAAGDPSSGVLFGTRHNDSLRILAWHATSFSVSDPRDLVRVLLAARHDPTLQTMQPLGWFVSHRDAGVSLSESDVEIFNNFFSEPWQVTLVLGRYRAGFFAREAEGQVRSDSSYQEFWIAAALRAKHLRWLWALPILFALVLAVLVIRTKSPEPVTPDFALRIQDDGQIYWDPASVRDSSRAEIDIQDGAQQSHFAITGAQLRQGQMFWQRHTGDVRVRMTVYPSKGSAVRESARLRVVTVTAPPAAPAQPEPDPEVKRLTLELHQERVLSDRLKNAVKALENRLGIDTAKKPPQ